MNIKAQANRLAVKHGTRDPFQIAYALGFLVIRAPMTGLRGFYQYIKRCHIIYINDALDEVQARLVCAHELGHYFLHRGMNRMFMNRATLAVTGKYEKEAHRFAVDLLYSDDDLLPYLSRPIADAAAFMGVPSSIAEYRLSTIR